MSDLIHKYNQKILELEYDEIKRFNQLTHPVIFIVAPPRSGTTLVYQLLSLKYDLFYPTNLLAKSYHAPYIFSKITQDLDILSLRESSLFDSNLGNTNSLLEPHEWGWFWEKFLVEKDTMLLSELAALQSIYTKPMIFKTIYFNYNIEKLNNLIPNAVFLYIKRNDTDNIYSIYEAIQKTNQPIGCKLHRDNFMRRMHNPIELATLEYYYDIKIIEKQLNNVEYLEISYDELLKNPKAVLKKFSDDFLSLTKMSLVKRQNKLEEFRKKEYENMDIKITIQEMIEKYKKLSLNELETILFGNVE